MFDDSRNPGMIGLLLGLVVLGGFGTLGAFVFDGRLNGEEATALDRRIDGFHMQIENANRKMGQVKDHAAAADKRVQITSDLEATKNEIKNAENKRTGLESTIADQQRSLEALQKSVTRYRDQVRKSAEGEKIASLRTTDGKSYQDAAIASVDDRGISIKHESGRARVSFLDLTVDWQKRFRYTPEEYKKAEDQEMRDRNTHSDKVDIASEEDQKRRKKYEAKLDGEIRQRKADSISREIAELDRKLEALQSEYNRDVMRTGYSSSRIVVSRSGQISRDIRGLEGVRARKQSELDRVMQQP